MSDKNVSSCEPLVSVIVPVYNVEEFLNQCVNSILSQEYKNIELILVNDGSSDSCPTICEDWKYRDSRVKVIHQSNKGLSSARNAGLELSIGEYVEFVDSDDWIESGLLSTIIPTMSSLHTDVSIFQANFASENGNKVWPDPDNSFFPSCETATGEQTIEFLLKGKLTNFSWKYVARRVLFTKAQIHFPEGRKFEDVTTTYKLFDEAKKVSFIPAPLYNYRQRGGSILHSSDLTSAFMQAEQAFSERTDYFGKRSHRLARLSKVNMLEWFIHLAWENHYKKSKNRENRKFSKYIDETVNKYMSIELLTKLRVKSIIQLFLVKTNLVSVVRWLSIQSGFKYKL